MTKVSNFRNSFLVSSISSKKKTFFGSQKTNLSDVNNTYIDIDNVQKFELSTTISLQTTKFMDRPCTRNDDTWKKTSRWHVYYVIITMSTGAQVSCNLYYCMIYVCCNLNKNSGSALIWLHIFTVCYVSFWNVNTVHQNTALSSFTNAFS